MRERECGRGREKQVLCTVAVVIVVVAESGLGEAWRKRWRSGLQSEEERVHVSEICRSATWWYL